MIRSGKNSRSLFWRSALILLLGTGFCICAAGAVTLAPQNSQSSGSVIANGDPVYIHGVATGQPRNGLQVWLTGNNYLKVSTISVDGDNTYTYELASADTRNLASGQYFVVIQHPMMNGQFDVVYDPATGKVTNRILGGGTTIFQMSGAGSLQGPASASALVQAISSQNIDDTFVTYSFFISSPTALINPIGDHAVGDKFTISGSTNLAVGDNLMVEITSASFKPTQKTQDNAFSGAAGMVKVVPGSMGYNHWSFDVDTSAFSPDEYIVTVNGIDARAAGSTTFNVLPSTVKTPDTPQEPAVIRTPVTSLTSLTPVPPNTTPTQKSPLPLSFGIMALVIFFVIRKW
jgi:trimeric autotransporter adhesin